MLAHLKGAPHLSQQQRLRDKEVDQYHRACALPIASHSSVYSGLLFVKVRARTGGFGLNDVLRLDNTKMQYSDRCTRLSKHKISPETTNSSRFWVEQKGKEKKLRPEHERFLDTSRLL